MKKLIFIFVYFLFVPTVLFADYILEPAHCTLKKKANCGAYLYNNKTGLTYFCDLEKCKKLCQQLRCLLLMKLKVQKNQKFQNLKKRKNQKFQSLKKNLNNLILVF